jgi:hypothetical protein
MLGRDMEVDRIVTVGGAATVVSTGGGGSGVRLVRMKIVSSLNDYLICRLADPNASQADIIVAKPWDLQRSPWDNITRNGIFYDFSQADVRVATGAGISQTERVNPPYAGGREIIAAFGIEGGTGVSVESVNDQKMNDPGLSSPQSWLIEPNSGWTISGGAARHVAGSGAGAFYQDNVLNPGSLYRVVLSITSSDEAGGVYVQLGTEAGETRNGTVYDEQIRCVGGTALRVVAAADTGMIITTVNCFVVEPAPTPWQDINAAGRQWAVN